MRIANLSPDGKIKLPEDMLKTLRQGEEFIVAISGETIILNPIRIPDVTKIAERVPGSEGEMSLEEISNEIHRYRQEKRRA